MMEGAAPLLGGIFFIICSLLMIGMIVGWVVFMVALWRGMKAHESIALTLKDINRNMNPEYTTQSENIP
ncbi:MAG: hypothetical protein ACE5IH_03305 [Thermodesulfobacteriota bacterium]